MGKHGVLKMGKRDFKWVSTEYLRWVSTEYHDAEDEQVVRHIDGRPRIG
jgi:hypothetical protein